MTEHNLNREQHFEQNWLLWVALHHFLPVQYLREMSVAMVRAASQSTLQLSDILEESTDRGTSVAEAWTVRPKKHDSKLASYLQDRVRAFVWKSDSTVFFDRQENWSEQPVSPATIEIAAELGRIDLLSKWTVPTERLENAQMSITAFIALLEKARRFAVAATPVQVDQELAADSIPIAMPLRGVVLKHLGDLFADVDNWSVALGLYEKSLDLFAHSFEPEWDAFFGVIRSIGLQSVATAKRIVSGASESVTVFDSARGEWNGINRVLFESNASHEAMWVRSLAGDKLLNDDRTSTLLSPMLIATHNIQQSLLSSQEKEYLASHVEFWGVLRRQIALGSSSQARLTKSAYCQSIVSSLDSAPQALLTESFSMAVRLAIESGIPKATNAIDWGSSVVERYVTTSAVEQLTTHAESHRGTRTERQIVAIGILKNWAMHLRRDAADPAQLILNYLAGLARENPASFDASQDVGGRSLEALKNLAEKRPDLLRHGSSAIADAIVARLTEDGWWTGVAGAAELAEAANYCFNDADLMKLAEGALSRLKQIPAAANFWVVVRPLQELLVSPKLRAVIRTSPELEQKTVAEILRFGLEQENDQARMMHLLRSFDASRLTDPQLEGAFQSALTKIRDRATQIQSSAATENIQALLNASAFSKRPGVETALDGLSAMLRSANDERPSLALPYAYAPLSQLASEFEKLARDVNMTEQAFADRLAPLVDLLANFWRKVAVRPTLLASFSIPPKTAPNAILAQNWALVSTQFASKLGQLESIEREIEAAAVANPTIRHAVERSRVINSLGNAVPSAIEPELVRTESETVFYLNLGVRLAKASVESDPEARRLCQLLVDMCAIHGPQTADLGVFALASRLKLQIGENDAVFGEYVRRLKANRDLYLQIYPFLGLLGYRPNDQTS